MYLASGYILRVNADPNVHRTNKVDELLISLSGDLHAALVPVTQHWELDGTDTYRDDTRGDR